MSIDPQELADAYRTMLGTFRVARSENMEHARQITGCQGSEDDVLQALLDSEDAEQHELHRILVHHTAEIEHHSRKLKELEG